MALEQGSYLSALNPANPASGDPVKQGDDHIRLVKSTLKNTFPNLAGPVEATHAQLTKLKDVTATAAELNRVAGLTEDLTTQITNLTNSIQANATAIANVGAAAETTPVGTVAMYAGGVVPSGWLFCNGQELDRTAYAALFTAIGTTYGAGNGVTTFNIPLTDDRFVRAAGTDWALGATHDSQNKAHTHSVSASGSTNSTGSHTHSVGNGGGGNAYQLQSSEHNPPDNGPTLSSITTSSSGNHSHSVTVSGTAASQGGTEAQPKGIVFNMIIKTGVT